MFSRNLFAGLGLAALLAEPVSPANFAERNFQFTYVAHVPAQADATKVLRLWIPVPQSNAYQTIRNLKISSPIAGTLKREDEYGNNYIFLELTGTQVQKPFDVTVQTDVTRREHRVALSAAAHEPADGTAASPAYLKRFLAPDLMVPTNGLIAQVAQQATQGARTPLEKARAIYEYVVSNMRYDKTGEGWGRGDAIFACTAKRGNCTEFHSLFIGMARAEGIPARFEIGFQLPAEQTAGPVPGYHCWAEFYVQPYGWIPVDASEAWKHPEKHEYFFGAHDADRIQFTVGRDLQLNPSPENGRLNYFVYPYAEADGKALAGIHSDFSFRGIPSDVPSAAPAAGDVGGWQLR